MDDHDYSGADPMDWLAALFRYEYCVECGGDAEHHTAVPFMGNPFARCDYPPSDAGEWHPIIVAYRRQSQIEAATPTAGQCG